MNDNVFGVTPVAGADQGDEPSPAPVSEAQDSSSTLEGDPQDRPAGPDPAPALAAEDEDAIEGVPVGELVKLGTRAYESIDQADRVFKQFAGRVRAELDRRRAAEAERDRLAGALEAFRSLQQSQQPPVQDDKGTPAEPPPPPQPKRLTDLVSDEEFDQLVAEHGPAKAFRRLAELTESRLAEALEESQRDIRPILGRAQAAERTAETFDRAAAMKDESGRPLYPEIADPNTPEAKAVFAIWQRNLQDPELAPLAFKPSGVRLAVNEYRAENGQPASRAPRTPAGAAVAARRAADRTLQSMGSGGAVGARPGGARTAAADEEQVQAIQRARQHPIFGVTVTA